MLDMNRSDLEYLYSCSFGKVDISSEVAVNCASNTLVLAAEGRLLHYSIILEVRCSWISMDFRRFLLPNSFEREVFDTTISKQVLN